MSRKTKAPDESYVSIFDNPWWGSDGGKPPPKEEFFFKYTDDDQHGRHGRQMRLEDFFQHNRVFMNGFGEPRTRTCHMDSYGTVVEYDHLEAALKLLEDQYHPTADDWRPHVETWVYGLNMPPPIQIVGRYIAWLAKIDIDEMKRKINDPNKL